MSPQQLYNLQMVLDDPIYFAQLVLKEPLEDIEPHHQNVLRSIAVNRKTAWKSAHGVGKTWTSSVSALWFLATRRHSKVIVTASAWRQVEKQLMPEIMRLARNADWDSIGLKDKIEQLKLQLYMKDSPDWFISAEASDEPAKMEGFHAPNLFYIVDEGKAVPAVTYESIEGAFTNVIGDVRELVISTPSAEKAGYFYEIFQGKRVGFTRFSTSAFESKRISPQWIAERKQEWGEDSPMYITRVLGEFADAGDDTLFPLSWIEKCQIKNDGKRGNKILGVDVARFGGDKTVICKRDGQVVEELLEYSKLDTMETAGKVVRLIKDENFTETRVDVIGVGAGVVDSLTEQGYNVNGINNAGNASDTEKFKNVRAESYWGLRERIKDGDIVLPDDDELITQLTSIKYRYNSRGQLEIESKEEMKKRGLHSPDKADSLVLAFYENFTPEPVLAIG